jgi:hypothetical protein
MNFIESYVCMIVFLLFYLNFKESYKSISYPSLIDLSKSNGLYFLRISHFQINQSRFFLTYYIIYSTIINHKDKKLKYYYN